MAEKAAVETQLKELSRKVTSLEEELQTQQQQTQHLEKERDRLVQLSDQLRLDEEEQREDAERLQMKHTLELDKLRLAHELEVIRLQREVLSERRLQLRYTV